IFHRRVAHPRRKHHIRLIRRARNRKRARIPLRVRLRRILQLHFHRQPRLEVESRRLLQQKRHRPIRNFLPLFQLHRNRSHVSPPLTLLFYAPHPSRPLRSAVPSLCLCGCPILPVLTQEGSASLPRVVFLLFGHQPNTLSSGTRPALTQEGSPAVGERGEGSASAFPERSSLVTAFALFLNTVDDIKRRKGPEKLMPVSAAVRAPLALNTISFEMRPVPSFGLDLTAWVLRRRPENLLDRWDGQTYRRALPLENKIVELAIQQIGSPSRPRLVVTAAAKEIPANSEIVLRRKIERLLGTQIDLRAFYALAKTQKHLRSLVTEFAGFKPPRYPTVFEALLSAISCQQVSLHVGIMLLNRV